MSIEQFSSGATMNTISTPAVEELLMVLTDAADPTQWPRITPRINQLQQEVRVEYDQRMEVIIPAILSGKTGINHVTKHRAALDLAQWYKTDHEYMTGPGTLHKHGTMRNMHRIAEYAHRWKDYTNTHT